MSTHHTCPILVQIPQFWLQYYQSFAYLLKRTELVPRHALRKCAEAFLFCNDEKEFAKTLLKTKKNLWLYRCNQQRFCGDFIIVDMSSPFPEKRQVYVLDLKMQAPLKLGGGGAGIQFRDVSLAIDELQERTDTISPDSPLLRITGDSRLILDFLGVSRPLSSKTLF